MGFWGSLWSGVKSFASKAVSVVSSAVKSVGSVIVEGAKKLLEFEIEKLKTVVEVIETIGKMLGIIKPEEDVEILGDKAMKADKKPEDFDSFNDYIEYLRNEISSSKEKIEKLPPEERLARKAIGSTILSKAISERKSLEIPMEFWKEAISKGLNAKEIDYFLTKFKNDGISPVDFVKYLKRELNLKEETKVEDSLIKAYKELEPSADVKLLEEKVINLQGK